MGGEYGSKISSLLYTLLIKKRRCLKVMKTKVWLWIVIAVVVIAAGILVWNSQKPTPPAEEVAKPADVAGFNPDLFVYAGAGDAETLDPSKAYDKLGDYLPVL